MNVNFKLCTKPAPLHEIRISTCRSHNTKIENAKNPFDTLIFLKYSNFPSFNLICIFRISLSHPRSAFRMIKYILDHWRWMCDRWACIKCIFRLTTKAWDWVREYSNKLPQGQLLRSMLTRQFLTKDQKWIAVKDFLFADRILKVNIGR